MNTLFLIRRKPTKYHVATEARQPLCAARMNYGTVHWQEDMEHAANCKVCQAILRGGG